MKYITFFFCLTLMFLTSCEIGDTNLTYEIQGQVVEYGTGTPVPNALIMATGYEDADGPVILLDSTRSDAEGYYSMTATGLAINALASKNGYDGRNSELPVNDDGSYRNLTLTLDPYAWLDVEFTNKSGAQSLEIYGFGVLDEKVYIPKDSTYRYFRSCLGNRDIYVFTEVKHNGVSSFPENLLYSNGSDTTYYKIDY